jgi:hypothetical protein
MLSRAIVPKLNGSKKTWPISHLIFGLSLAVVQLNKTADVVHCTCGFSQSPHPNTNQIQA